MHERGDSAWCEIIARATTHDELIRVKTAIRKSHLPSAATQLDVAAVAAQRTERGTGKSTRNTPLRQRDSTVECNEAEKTGECQHSRAPKTDR